MKKGRVLKHCVDKKIFLEFKVKNNFVVVLVVLLFGSYFIRYGRSVSENALSSRVPLHRDALRGKILRIVHVQQLSQFISNIL